MSKLYQLCMRRQQEHRPTISEILSLPYVIEISKKYSLHIGYRKPKNISDTIDEIMIIDQNATIMDVETSRDIYPR